MTTILWHNMNVCIIIQNITIFNHHGDENHYQDYSGHHGHHRHHHEYCPLKTKPTHLHISLQDEQNNALKIKNNIRVGIRTQHDIKNITNHHGHHGDVIIIKSKYPEN